MPTTSDAVGTAFERAISRAVNEMMSGLVKKLIKKAAEELGIGQLVREMTELTKEPWTSNAYKTVEAAAKVEDELKRINSLLPEPERFDFERRGRFVVYPKRAQEHIETAEKNCDVLGIQLSDHMLFEQESSAELDRVKSDTIPRLNREFGGEWEGVLIRDELKRAVDTEFAAKLAEELRARGVFCSASNGVLVFRISDTDAILHAAEKALGGEARLVDQLKRDLNPDQGENRAEVSHDMQGPATPGQLKFIDDLYAAGEITDKEMADFKLDETAQAASNLLASKGRELKEKPTAPRAEVAPSAFASTAMANTLSVLAADNMIDAEKYANFKANMTVANFHLCIEKGTDSTTAPDALQRRAAELMQKQGVPIGEDDYKSVESLRWAMDRRAQVPVRDADMLGGETSDIAVGAARADAGETMDLSGIDKTTVLDGADSGEGAPLQDIPSQQPPTGPSLTAPIANPSAPAADIDYLKASTQVMDVPGTDEKTRVEGTQTVPGPAPAPLQEQQENLGADSTQKTGPDIARQSMEAQRREDIGNTQTTADYVQSKPDTGDMDPSTPYGDQCDPSGAGDKDGNGIRDAAEDFDGDSVPNAEDPDLRPPMRRTVDHDMYPVVEQEDLDEQIASAETSMHLDSRSDRGIETHNDRNITGR